MNRLMQEQWPWVEGTHAMRTQLLDVLTDADLTFNPGGQNMALGALIKEMGDVQYSYAQSLKTFKQNFEQRNQEPGLDRSVARLKVWFQTLDDDMKGALSAQSDADLGKTIDRGGFSPDIKLQLDVYIQALLIFYGKVTIFLRAMNKPIPAQIQEWIW